MSQGVPGGRCSNAPTRRVRLALVVGHRLMGQIMRRWLTLAAGDVDVVASVGSVAELRTSAGWGAPVVVLDDVAHVAELVAAGSRVVVLGDAGEEELLAAIRGAAHRGPEPTGRPRLSPQERRTLCWYGGGLPLKSVALRLGVTEGAVKSYVDRIREKYDRVGRTAPTKVDLYRRAVEDGYLSAS